MDYYLGIDVGTSKVKSVLFDAQFNECLVASASNVTLSPQPGYAEQNMTQLWNGVVETLRIIAASPLLINGKINAIGLSGQGEGVWLLDKNGEPFRHAILWSDVRSAADVAFLKAQPGLEESLFTVSGTRFLPGNSSLILRWLWQNERPTIEKAGTCFFAKDWIRYQLTGEAWLELTDTGTSLLDLHSETLSDRLFGQLELNEMRHLFPPLLPSNGLAGHVTEGVAALTGLVAGIPVCAGALDVSAAALGLGAVSAGDVYTILGTTCCTGIVCDSLANVSYATRFVAHAQKGAYINLFAMQSGTPNIDWARAHLAEGTDFSAIDEQIAQVPVGSGGVFYQPYLKGERAPFYNQSARAGFFGISQETTNSHLLRAVFEGLAFAIADSLSEYPGNGDLYIAGGGAASDNWLQIIADCTGRRVITQTTTEFSARGAAMLAAQSIGDTVTINETNSAATRRIFHVDAQQHLRYQHLFPLFRQLRDILQPLWIARELALDSLDSLQEPL